VRGAVPRPPSSAASSAHASAPRTTSLGDETRRYERAAAALRAGEPIAAAEELRAYLARYPQGTLRDEARLSLLEARFAAGDFRGARDLAVELAADDALRSRRREIVEVLVRAQIALGACDAARVSLDARDARGDAAALREELSRCDEREPEQ
jgi:TolA-binding protein